MKNELNFDELATRYALPIEFVQELHEKVVDKDNFGRALRMFKGGIKTKFHRTFEGIVKSSTISRTATGKYFVSILVEVNEPDVPMKPICENKTVGIDLGIKTFAVL